jgi:UDP-N-acetylmuramoyl-tripeptide--D-alanyl-D-alanine ligase
MIALTIARVSEVLGGSLHGTDGAELITSVVVDSREVSGGSLFVAIQGERVDGHDYASSASSNGAVVVLSERVLDVPCIVVPNTVEALGMLGKFVRDQLSCTVIGITGSSGKTSTKDLLESVLSEFGETIAPVGSFNTEVGVPLTILRATLETRFLILEMGMRGLGHIEYLCDLSSPTIGVLLNIGSAHIGMLGSQKAIAQAKGELIEGLPSSGLAILNGDDPFVREQAVRTQARVVFFGESGTADVRASDVDLDPMARPKFTLHYGGQEAKVKLRVHGEHFVSNALAVASIALEIGLPLDEVAAALSKATIQSKWRMEVTDTPDGVIVINDAYNANPESMRAALKTLAAMGTEQTTWAVLGEMLELGDDSMMEHDAIGRLAVRLDVSRLICVGPGTRVMHLAASNEGSWGDESMWVQDADAAIAVLREELLDGDIVLIKASRGVGLERVAAALTDQELP